MDVTITDVLDQGLDFVEASDGGEYDAATRTVTWTLKDVPAEAQGVVKLVVTVNEKAYKEWQYGEGNYGDGAVDPGELGEADDNMGTFPIQSERKWL